VAYAEETEQLLALVGAAGQAQVQQALEAASFEIDTAFSTGGYVVPLDLSAIDDAATRTRFTAKLSTVCQALAGGILGSVPTKNRAVPGKVVKDRNIAKEWLKQIAARKIEFPYLGRARAAGVRVVGGSTWAATEAQRDYADGVFDAG
jgi:hypothetical protein